MTTQQIKAQIEICEKATKGPWHYEPCGEKINDCVLGVAYDAKGKSPPSGRIECSPYNDSRRDYDYDKYILDPVIATMENDANYADFAFIVACADPATGYAACLAQLKAAMEREKRLLAYWSDIEARSKEAHAVYQTEAHRRGDVRHPDEYNQLSEATKDWDRVLVRWVNKSMREALGDGK